MSNAQSVQITNATVANSGIYNLVVIVNGCPSAAENINIVVKQTPAIPAITTNSPVFTGDLITFSTTSTGIYNWTGQRVLLHQAKRLSF